MTSIMTPRTTLHQWQLVARPQHPGQFLLGPDLTHDPEPEHGFILAPGSGPVKSWSDVAVYRMALGLIVVSNLALLALAF